MCRVRRCSAGSASVPTSSPARRRTVANVSGGVAVSDVPERPWVAAALVRAQALEQPAFIRVLSETETSEAAAGAPVRGRWPACRSRSRTTSTSPGCRPPPAAPPAPSPRPARRRRSSGCSTPARCRSARRTWTSSPPAWSAPARPYGACHSVYSARPRLRRQQLGQRGRGRRRRGAARAGHRHRRLRSGAGGLQRHRRGQADPRPGLHPRRAAGAPSLDCVTTFTRTVAEARAALGVLAGPDPEDPWSRRRRCGPGRGARDAGVVAVPAGRLDLDRRTRRRGRRRWRTRRRGAAGAGGRPRFLAAAQLLYGGPWVAERLAAFGDLLEPDGPHLDPAVRRIVLGADAIPAPRLRGQPARRAAHGRRATFRGATRCCCRSRRGTRRSPRSPPTRSGSTRGWARTPTSSTCSTCARSRCRPASGRTACRSGCS